VSIRGTGIARAVTKVALLTGFVFLALAAPAAGRHGEADATAVLVKLTDSTLVVTPRRVPIGQIHFKIVNRGTTQRSFAIGRQRKPVIGAGRAVTLSAALARRGPRTLVSTSRGRGERLTGVLDVFEPCTHPVTTTVDLKMDHDRSGLSLSRTTIPCGTVTFVVTNAGRLVDSLIVFAEFPAAKGSTPTLKPGETARLTIKFMEKGMAYYQSDEYPPSEPEFGGSDADGGAVPIV
jgi:hypothetical protein